MHCVHARANASGGTLTLMPIDAPLGALTVSRYSGMAELATRAQESLLIGSPLPMMSLSCRSSALATALSRSCR